MAKDANELIGELYLELANKFLWVAQRTLGGSRDLAEEAVHRAFERACEHKAQLLASENPQGWMRLALKHTINRMIAERVRENELIDRVGRMQVSHSPHHRDEEDIDLIFGDMKDDPDYLLVKKHYLEGWSIEELADEYGISYETCRKRIYRARERLRKRS